MAVALPGGFVDCGSTIDLTCSFTVRTRMVNMSMSINALIPGIDAWILRATEFADEPFGDPPQHLRVEHEFIKRDVDATEWEEVSTTEGPYPEPPDPAFVPQFAPTLTFQSSAGPFRVGKLVSVLNPLAPKPWLASNYKEEIGVFIDENTTFLIDFGGHTQSGYVLRPEGGTPDPGTTPVLWGDPFIRLHLAYIDGPDNTTVLTEIRGLTVQGELVDTGALADGTWTGLGGGDIDGRKPVSTGGEIYVWLPYLLDYDLDVLQYGGSSTGCVVTTQNIGDVAVPHSSAHVYHRVSWASSGLTSATETLAIKGSSATGDFDPDVTTGERPLRLWISPGRTAPGSDGSYTPTTITIDGEQSVLRPDGVAAADLTSSFVASSGDIVVTETDAETQAVVGAIGSHITRTLGAVGTDLPEWRRWLGVGVSGHADALFNMDLEGKTKHTAQADIFDWVGYGYARLGITAPATGDLTLTVSGVYPVTSDNHETGSSREAAFSVDESTTFSVSWALPVVSGSGDYEIDLAFPDSLSPATVPFDIGRVDSIVLSGLLVGTYHLTAFDLIAKDPKTASLKLGFGFSSGDAYVGGSADYDALHVAHNAAPMMANLTDQTACSELLSEDGRGVRFVDILTGAVSGEVLDTEETVETFTGHTNDVEGVGAVYSSSAYQAANQDSFGVALGPELAEWLNDQLPGLSLTADVAQTLPAQPKVGQINLVPGIHILIRTRDSRGYGGVEGLAVEDGARAGIGGTVTVTRDSNAAAYTAGTDAHGGFICSPLPQDGTESYSTA